MGGAVLTARPADADFADYVSGFSGNPYIKGFRQVLQVLETPQGTCLSDAFIAGIRLLGDRGFLFDICIRPGELADGASLVEQCPDTQFVVDHCGNPDPNVVEGSLAPDTDDIYAHGKEQWKRDMGRLARSNNTTCKISGIVARVNPGWRSQDLAPTIDFCLDVFGPDRVVFGGDWPVCTLGTTYREWVQALRDVISKRSEADQRKLLHDNAVRLYGL